MTATPATKSKASASTLDFVFYGGLALKGLDSLLEVAGGVLLSMPTKLARYLTVLAEHDVFRHHEALAGKINNLATAVTMNPSIGEAVYLGIHGLAKAILIVAILFGKRWGYQGLAFILALFALIELGRAVTEREVFTGAFGLFDLGLAWFIFQEYKKRFGDAKDANPQV